MNIYQIGQGGYLGAVAQIEPDAGCPAGFTRTEPPEIPEGSFAVWAGTGWEITDVAYVAPVFVDAPVVPQQVTMRQACLALENAGILDDVEALVATLPRPYQIEWERASVVNRDNALVETVRAMQGMTVEQIDDLFRLAETL